MTCFGCIHLLDKPDAAGGGTYFCGRVSKGQLSGLVIGEYGAWCNASDDPRPLQENCFEAEEEKRG